MTRNRLELSFCVLLITTLSFTTHLPVPRYEDSMSFRMIFSIQSGKLITFLIIGLTALWAAVTPRYSLEYHCHGGFLFPSFPFTFFYFAYMKIGKLNETIDFLLLIILFWVRSTVQSIPVSLLIYAHTSKVSPCHMFVNFNNFIRYRYNWTP